MLIFLIYLPLILKGFFFITRIEKKVPALPQYLGKVEYFVSPWRDTLLAALLFFFGVYRLFLKNWDATTFAFLLLPCFSLVNRIQRQRFRLALCPWILNFDAVEPNAFFKVYKSGLGSFTFQLPEQMPSVDYSYIDYRLGKEASHSVLPLLQGGIDTTTLAKLAILAMKTMPDDAGIDAFDSFARIWGARFVAQARLRLKTVCNQGLPKLDGKVLLVFNHKSYLDFALNFFALGNLRNGKRHLRPRFIAAKDHFIDNPLIYSWLGLGKCIQDAGMIFINRTKGKGWLAMKEAAEKLVNRDVEVAVYPQGTRAWGLHDDQGERIDAGYYTTFHPKNLADPRGHLKNGTAQLILDTALELRKEGKPALQVLFIGLDGTATVGPKGSFKIQRESDVTFHVGQCWKVELPGDIEFQNPEGKAASCEAHENYVAQIQAIHEKIDREMEKSIRRHATLLERILKDPRVPQDKESLRRLQDFLKRADATENILPFVVLDRIYALPPSAWEKHLRHYSQLAWQAQQSPLGQESENDMWEGFNLKVSKELTQG